jgi:hypothetical protein
VGFACGIGAVGAVELVVEGVFEPRVMLLAGVCKDQQQRCQRQAHAAASHQEPRALFSFYSYILSVWPPPDLEILLQI